MKRLTLMGIIIGAFATEAITPLIPEWAPGIGFLVGLGSAVVAHKAIPNEP